MSPRLWAITGTVVIGSIASGAILRPISTSAATNRFYGKVRKESEFEPLLTLPNPLLANFGFYSDTTSQKVSEALKNIVSSDETPIPLSFVDVECDEPDAQVLVQRYVIGHYPTVLAFRGGYLLSQFIPDKGDQAIEESLKKWIADELSNK